MQRARRPCGASHDPLRGIGDKVGAHVTVTEGRPANSQPPDPTAQCPRREAAARDDARSLRTGLQQSDGADFTRRSCRGCPCGEGAGQTRAGQLEIGEPSADREAIWTGDSHRRMVAPPYCAVCFLGSRLGIWKGQRPRSGMRAQIACAWSTDRDSRSRVASGRVEVADAQAVRGSSNL
jgi:hypothetical protein